MEESDKQRYIQDQVNIEIEHVRSWPTKAMAFYVAINFGIISGLIALQKFKPDSPLLSYMKPILAGIVIVLAIYVYFLLHKLNKTYIKSRKMQIKLQNKLFNSEDQTEYEIPNYWFGKKNDDSWLQYLCSYVKNDCDLCKYPGWLFYVFVLIIVTSLVVIGIFTIG